MKDQTGTSSNTGTDAGTFTGTGVDTGNSRDTYTGNGTGGATGTGTGTDTGTFSVLHLFLGQQFHIHYCQCYSWTHHELIPGVWQLQRRTFICQVFLPLLHFHH